MRLRVKRGFFCRHLVDENDKKLATIKNKRGVFAPKKIYDEKGKLIYITDIINSPKRRYIIYKKGKAFAKANIFFGGSLFTAPPAIQMNIKSPYGTWEVKRNNKNAFIIKNNGEEIGKIISMLDISPTYIECSEEYSASFWASVYALSEYMINENDLIIF